jgi:hypothetical protein
MVEQLFGSKTRVKLLHLFYGNPNRSFYVREITRKIDEQINSVRRELSNLLSIGIISSETNNNRLYYEVDQKFEHYEALSTIFGEGGGASAARTTEDKVADYQDDSDIKSVGNVELALLTGQFTRDTRSGVDLLVVGDINEAKMAKYVADAEKKENKEISYAVMSPSELAYRIRVNDRFILQVLESKKQILIDKNKVLDKADAKSTKSSVQEPKAKKSAKVKEGDDKSETDSKTE